MSIFVLLNGLKIKARTTNEQGMPKGDLGPNILKSTCDGALQSKARKLAEKGCKCVSKESSPIIRNNCVLPLMLSEGDSITDSRLKGYCYLYIKAVIFAKILKGYLNFNYTGVCISRNNFSPGFRIFPLK